MIKIAYVSNKGKYQLAKIQFDTLEEVKKYTSRWFPTEDLLFVEIYEERKESQDA